MFTLIGLLFVTVFSVFVFRSLKITKKQKQIIEVKSRETEEQKRIAEEQKHLVEEKQKEIIDSIQYARRIQRALITNEKYISKSLTKLKRQI
jgi:serine phosphatase RsbU (regulator of sigma subunit)